LVATARSLIASHPRQALLLAVAAHQRAQTPETLGALQATLSRSGPVLGWLGYGTAYLDAMPIGEDSVVATRVDGIDLFDTDARTMIDSVAIEINVDPLFPFHDQLSSDASTNGLLAVASGIDVRVFDVTTSIAERPGLRMPAVVQSVSVAPDGSTIVAADRSGNVRAVDRDGGLRFEMSFDTTLTVVDQALTVFPDAFLLPFWGEVPAIVQAEAHADHVHIGHGGWTHEVGYDGEPLRAPTFLYAADPAMGTLPVLPLVHVHDDPRTIVANSFAIGAIGPDAGPTTELAVMADTWGGGKAQPYVTVLVDGDPVTLLSDGSAARFDVTSGGRLEELDLGIGSVSGGETNAAGNAAMIATSSGVALLALDESGPLTVATARRADQTQVSISADGRYAGLGSGGGAGPLELLRYDGSAYTPIDGIAFGEGPYAAIAPNADGTFVAWDVAGQHLYDLQTGTDPELIEFRGHGPNLVAGRAGTMSMARREFVNASVVGIFVHDMGEIHPPRAIPLPEPGIPTVVRYSPDGSRLLVAVRSGRATWLDTATWEAIDDRYLAQLDIAMIDWNGDGSLAATASSSGQVTIRDGATLEPIREMVGPIGTENSWGDAALLFSPDNSLLLTNHDRVGRLWDLASGEQIGIEFPTHRSSNTGINVGDYLQLATVTERHVLTWNLDVTTWPAIACSTASSNLTRDEWQQWGPRDEPSYRAICDQFPIEELTGGA
jgi:WD40 repeat protein